MTLDWIRVNDYELYEGIKYVSLERIFANGNRPGTTFLMPTGATRTKILQGLTIDASEEESNEAGRQIAALVIVDNFPSPESFKAASQVPNCLKQNIAVDHAKCTKDSIAFACGATVKLRAHVDERTHIYSLVGQIPTDLPTVNVGLGGGRRIVASAPAPKPKGIWSPDAYNVTSQSKALRVKFARETESHYTAEQIQADITGGHARPIFTMKVVGLVDHIIENCSEQAIADLLPTVIIPMLSFEPADFYIFVEPYKSTGKYILPTEIIANYAKGSVDVSIGTLNRVEAAIERFKGNSAVINSRVELAVALDEIRESVLSVKDRRKLPDDIIEKYNSVFVENKFADYSRVVEEATVQLYRQNPIYKLNIDELRYVTGKLFDRLESEKFNAEYFNRILNLIQAYTAENTLLRVMDTEGIKHSIGPQEKISDIMTFVNSKYFMFVPLLSSELADFKTKIQTTAKASGNADAVWYPLDERPYIPKTSSVSGSGYSTDSERTLQLLNKLKAGGGLDAATKALITQMLAAEEQGDKK